MDEAMESKGGVSKERRSVSCSMSTEALAKVEAAEEEPDFFGFLRDSVVEMKIDVWRLMLQGFPLIPSAFLSVLCGKIKVFHHKA
jgi:hypothetical protein